MKLNRKNAFELAIKTAALSQTQFKLGAVIVDKRGKLLSIGYNQAKTHPMGFKYGKTKYAATCAETHALVRCKGEPHSIYVARIRADNKTGMAKPCPACQAMLDDAGVKRVYFTTGE